MPQDDQGQMTGDALGEGLGRYAMAKRHLSERPPPRLHPRRDGSYRYEGPSIRATIRPDGQVEFDDHQGDMVIPPLPMFVFDLTDAMMRANGEDPYQYEREWFMRETEGLRNRLADRSEAEDLRRGLGDLRARLERIWDNRALSAQARRGRIFDLWDDCADDELGRRAQAVVLAFIRERLPAGSPNAYPRAEIQALNDRRISPVPFAPYG
jgi:hypothetical protein